MGIVKPQKKKNPDHEIVHIFLLDCLLCCPSLQFWGNNNNQCHLCCQQDRRNPGNLGIWCPCGNFRTHCQACADCCEDDPATTGSNEDNDGPAATCAACPGYHTSFCN